MTIYGEYLFLENAIAGFLILALTSGICGAQASRPRLIFGSILCGIYSFIIFCEGISWGLAALIKVLFSMALIVIVFNWGRWRKYLKILMVFYIISFVFGGLILASLYFFKGNGITSSGAFYIGRITYLRLSIGMFAAWIVMLMFSRFIKGRLIKNKIEAKLRIKQNGKEIILKGFIDTGNFLKDPISGRPVCIASKAALIGLSFEEKQFCIIPYKSIDNPKGILRGVRLDKTELIIKEKSKIIDIVLALSEASSHMGGNGEEYDVILHESLIGGGILIDG